jgi:hypothetical protein
VSTCGLLKREKRSIFYLVLFFCRWYVEGEREERGGEAPVEKEREGKGEGRSESGEGRGGHRRVKGRGEGEGSGTFQNLNLISKKGEVHEAIHEYHEFVSYSTKTHHAT